jgi:murein DD-endopeptidase MepM/ murein hydrolase activator NlpD
VYSSASGTVKKIDFDENLGIYIVLSHLNGIETIYGHLFAICVEVGQIIEIGEQIGFVGKTGRATGFHLHFGIKENGEWKNPCSFLFECK